MFDILCSFGWHESFCIRIFGFVGSLYTVNSNFLLLWCIIRSRKLMELWCLLAD
jgi:hypothetical protein